MTAKHIVKYRESESGWGGETWYRPFDTMEEAAAAIQECNEPYRDIKFAPDYYIIASYETYAEYENTKYAETYKH
jgi:hypothetical protein